MKFSFEKTLTILVFLIIVLGILIPQQFFAKPIKSTAIVIFAPLQKAGLSVSQKTKNFFLVLKEIKDLAIENQELKREILQLSQENIDLKERAKENVKLRQELNFKNDHSQFELIYAPVIGLDPTKAIDYLTIKAGLEDGVKVGAPVVFNGVLVGKINEVYKKFSKVILISSPQNLINGQLVGSSTRVLLRGRVDFSLSLEGVPNEVEVKEGERIVSSGDDQVPPGLLLGQVSNIKKSTAGVFQEVLAEPLVNAVDLSFVGVIVGLDQFN